MIHLGEGDYKVMPWANGKGTTTELWREDRGGAMLWRLSRAAVVENGPFSPFPGIHRNLTVIDGPGFDLVAPDLCLPARPLQPVAFSGDLAIRADHVSGPSVDVNVMVAAHLAPPVVWVERDARRLIAPDDGFLCLYALDALTVSGRAMRASDLILSREDVDKGAGLALVVLVAGVAG